MNPDIKEKAEMLVRQMESEIFRPDAVSRISQALTAEREAGRAEERERCEAAASVHLQARVGGETSSIEAARLTASSILFAIRNPET